MKKVLFVCTGNTCRSPMAAALLRKLAAEAGVPVEVRSAGVAAAEGERAARPAVKVMRDWKIDHENHRSRPVTEELIQWADVIFTMTEGHRRLLIQAHPSAVDKVHVLKEYVHEGGEHIALLQRWSSVQAEMETRRALLEKVEAEGDKERREALQTELKRLTKEAKRIRETMEETKPDWDIQDPFGGDEEEYRRCARELESVLRRLIRKWSGDGPLRNRNRKGE